MEHAADQRGGVDGQHRCIGRIGCICAAMRARRGPQVARAHKVASLAAGLDQATGLQLVVRGHHGVRADLVASGAFAHRGQARARGQQVLLDALGKTLHQLLGQGLFAVSAQGAVHGARTVLYG
mgnify:CR=1 FL=1